MTPQHTPDRTGSSRGLDDGATSHSVQPGPGALPLQKAGVSDAVSCEVCKLRKVRCDRRRPTCGWCIRNQHRCEYKERKRPGLRAGYGKELESRLDRLEGVLQTQQQLLSILSDRLASSSVPPNRDFDASTRAYDEQDTGMHALTHAQASGNNINTNPTVYGPQRSVQGGPLSPSGAVAATPTSAGTVRTEESARSAYPAPSQSTFSCHDLPAEDLMFTLTNLYFERVNPWCPILHRQNTFRLLFTPAVLEQEDIVVLHAIVVSTIGFAEDERLSDAVRDRHYRVSKQKVLLHGLEESSVRVLQSLLVVAFDAVGRSNGPPSWNLLALITRNVIQLGLAVEDTSFTTGLSYPSIATLRANVLPTPNSFVEEESRRRVFWAAYLLDRFATVATALDFSLDEGETQRRLPCREDFFSAGHPVITPWVHNLRSPDQAPVDQLANLGPFSYYIGVVAILSKIHSFLRRPINIGAEPQVLQWQREYRELDGQLRAWHDDLPSQYSEDHRSQSCESSPRIDSMWIMLNCTYYMTIIRLHSSAAYPTHRSPLFTPSTSASQRCLKAVESICSLCTLARGSGLLNHMGPSFAFCIWVAARLLLVHGSTVDRHIDPAIDGLVKTLNMLGQRWPMAYRYSTLLQRVLDEYHESERNDNHGTPGSEAPSVQILADMRRCAYDLDLLISRQPRLQVSPLPATTHAAIKPPGHNELEYLDVFDFFNMPRLPHPGDFQLDMSGLSTDPPMFASGNASPYVDFNPTDALHTQGSDWLDDYNQL